MDWIDGSYYPDQETPEHLESMELKVDFIARMCGAWDFGMPPDPSTLSQVLGEEWRSAVEETRQLTSCAYHLLRELHGLEPLPYKGPSFPEILNDPCFSSI